ncbi:MAG TPA: hypothetical protein PKY59_03975 [Pyrinomonadaceae bacterium]|nr:hypothetical protein [Pyrinomonadaceae bacterium]
MKTLTQVEPIQLETASDKSFAIDTTFVLFFLAVELGQSMSYFALDTAALAITLSMLLVLPYFLPSDDKPSFGNWVLGRTCIAVFALVLGVMFRQTLGTVLPETFRFIPMTLLIVTAMLSCYIQYYGLLKVRLAK